MSISIIIPTLNEAATLAEVIEAARQTGNAEIIVVDGGSNDETLAIAAKADVCLSSERGRAQQQNAGAKIAKGNILLFLHADCLLKENCCDAIRSAMQNKDCIGGCFQQQIDAKGLRYRLLEKGNAMRVHCCKWAYGDQGIFVKRDTFEQVGGFPDIQLMEDLYLMKRLKKEGTFSLLNARIIISARRWQQKGVVRQTLRNWAFVTLAHIGVSPNWLAKYYPHVR